MVDHTTARQRSVNMNDVKAQFSSQAPRPQINKDVVSQQTTAWINTFTCGVWTVIVRGGESGEVGKGDFLYIFYKVLC